MESYEVQIITGRMVESNEYRDQKTISGIGTGGSGSCYRKSGEGCVTGGFKL